jgi:hypothetical protein
MNVFSLILLCIIEYELNYGIIYIFGYNGTKINGIVMTLFRGIVAIKQEI